MIVMCAFQSEITLIKGVNKNDRNMSVRNM